MTPLPSMDRHSAMHRSNQRANQQRPFLSRIRDCERLRVHGRRRARVHAMYPTKRHGGPIYGRAQGQSRRAAGTRLRARRRGARVGHDIGHCESSDGAPENGIHLFHQSELPARLLPGSPIRQACDSSSSFGRPRVDPGCIQAVRYARRRGSAQRVPHPRLYDLQP